MNDFWENLHSLSRWQKIAILGATIALAIGAYILMGLGVVAVVFTWWREIVQVVAVVIGGAILLHLFLSRR